MKKISRRNFVSSSLKGLAGICLFGLVGCSKKEKLEENFWETKDYKKTLEEIYKLANKAHPENSYAGNQAVVSLRMRDHDKHKYNPDMIDEDENVINHSNYHPSPHALKRTLRAYEAKIAAAERGENPNNVGDFSYKH